MKKVIIFLILIGIAVLLSSCSLNYKKYDAKINGEQLYVFDEFIGEVTCDKISAWDVIFTYEDEIYAVKNSGISSCNSTLYVKDGTNFISLTNALDSNIFELEDLLNYNWDFEIFKLYFPLNDIDIERIIMTDELGLNEDYIITDLDIIQSIKNDMYFYCSGFISGFEYDTKEIISYISIYDTEGNSYNFSLKESGTIYIDEDMYSDNPNRFNYIFSLEFE